MAVTKKPIDKIRLYDALKSRNLRPQEISEAIGYDADWISNNVSRTNERGGLPVWFISLLEHQYGIPYSEYEPLLMVKAEDLIVKSPMPVVSTTMNMYITGFSKEAMDQIAECFYEALIRDSKSIKPFKRENDVLKIGSQDVLASAT